MKTFNAITEARSYSTENPTELTECKCFYANGNIYEHSFYLNSKQHGEGNWFYEDGNIAEHCFYKNGKPHGECKWLYNDGSIKEHCFYKDGKEQLHLHYLTTERDEVTLTLLFGDYYI